MALWGIKWWIRHSTWHQEFMVIVIREGHFLQFIVFSFTHPHPELSYCHTLPPKKEILIQLDRFQDSNWVIFANMQIKYFLYTQELRKFTSHTPILEVIILQNKGEKSSNSEDGTFNWESSKRKLKDR